MAEVKLKLKKALMGAEGPISLDVEFELEKGSFTILAGPSGAGKTSILRMISGLMNPDEGQIEVHGQHWFDSSRNINEKARKRVQGFVFQDYALFPQMTVGENLLFAKPNKEDRRESQNLMQELLEIMDLSGLKYRKAESLSGGQQQRVALARALMRRPRLLLLDEPFAALDPQMRQKMQSYILRLHNRFGLTTLMVSHDRAESINLADKVIVLQNGKISQSGLPEKVFAQKHISGKFRFTGEILSIRPADVVFVITVLIGKEQVKVIADKKEAASFKAGDKVLVVSKAFNPILRKIDTNI